MHKEILVIDDNPDIRLLVSSILKDQKYDVRTAANYDQAIFEINKKLPDLAIIDIKLDKPDKDGIDLLKYINKDSYIYISIVAGRLGDSGKSPTSVFKKTIKKVKNFKIRGHG